MTWRRKTIGLLFAALFVAGCGARQGLPPDPLFAERKPTEIEGKSGPPIATPFTDPAPAPNKYVGEFSPFSARRTPSDR